MISRMHISIDPLNSERASVRESERKGRGNNSGALNLLD